VCNDGCVYTSTVSFRNGPEHRHHSPDKTMTIDGSQAGQTARGGPAIRISSTTRDMLDGIKATSPMGPVTP